MCRANSSALNSPEPSQAKRAALLTSNRDGRHPPSAAKIASAQLGSARSATTLTAPRGPSSCVMMDVSNHGPAVREQRARYLQRRPACRRRSRLRCALCPSLRHSCLEPTQRSNPMTRSMPESPPTDRIEGLSLTDLQQIVDARQLPPVDQWNPERCGHSGMRIAADGTWFHEGSPIQRPAMVRLFSTVLRREPDGRHVLSPLSRSSTSTSTAPRSVRSICEAKALEPADSRIQSR